VFHEGERSRTISGEFLRRQRSFAKLWEQLREDFEVRVPAKNYLVAYFSAESEAKLPTERGSKGQESRSRGSRIKWAPTRSVGRRPFKPSIGG